MPSCAAWSAAALAPARMLTHTRILLTANHGEGGPGWSDAAIGGALDVNPSTVLRVRRQFVTAGLAATLARKRPDLFSQRALDGKQEAKLIALASAETPDGAERWSLRFLADELVRLDMIATISHETVRQTLKKTTSSRAAAEQWCLAPTADPAFVWHMEDVLDVYHRPCDPLRPVVCLDETSRQLLGEARPPTPTTPGQPARHDPASVRNGVANCFLVTEPLRGWRAVMVSDQRTRLDFAACVKDLSRRYPEAERVVLVLDQLNTLSPHRCTPPSRRPSQTAGRQVGNPPYPETRVLARYGRSRTQRTQRQCLRQRLPDRAAMERAVTAWANRRNAQTKRIHWQFTTAHARTKLRRLYPALKT